MSETKNQIEFIVDAPVHEAYNFGETDAKDGEDARGGLYFGLDSVAWLAYNRGYVAGWRGDPMVVKWMADGCPMPRDAFMDCAYDVLPWEQRDEYVGD